MTQAVTVKPQEDQQAKWKRINDELAELIIADVSGEVDTEEKEIEWKREFRFYAGKLYELAREMDRECVVTFEDGGMAGIWYSRKLNTAHYNLWNEDDVESFLEDNGGRYV